MKFYRWVYLAVLCTFVSTGFAAPAVRINEFMADNGNVFADEFQDYPDWIELYNNSDQPVNLLGWSLTDDPDDTQKWTFPNITIGARGFLMVHASGRNITNGTRLHANFSLSEGGDFLGLFDNTGAVATVCAATTPPPAGWSRPVPGSAFPAPS